MIAKLLKTMTALQNKVLEHQQMNKTILENIKVSMIRKYDNHTLQSNFRDHEGEPHLPTGTRRQDDNKNKATRSISLFQMIAKIVSIIRKYHNHKPQTTPWHREEESLERALSDA